MYNLDSEDIVGQTQQAIAVTNETIEQKIAKRHVRMVLRDVKAAFDKV